MAIIFELWIECGCEADAQAVAKHFDGLSHTLLNGHKVSWHAGIQKDDPKALIVDSHGLSNKHIRTMTDAMEVTEAGLRLYHHLKTAPPFRFARADWEAANIPLADLPDWVETWNNSEAHLNLSCVMDMETYVALGSPRYFDSFREGYVWRKYRGESYQPLYSNDQTELNALCRQLLPEYFSY